MNILKTAEFKVGALVAAVLALIVIMSFQISEDPNYLRASKILWFLIPDANGLIPNSAVKMAGIDVGIIKDIKLNNGLARVEMSIRADLPISSSSRVEIRANGILGDKYVEIIPGDPQDPPLNDDDQILQVKDSGSLASIMNEVGNIAGSLGSVAETLETAATGEGDRTSPIGRIINNLELFTEDLAQISNENKGKITEILENVQSISANINDIVEDDSEDGFRAAWASASRSLENIEEITEKINNGEGTIGQLINDDTTVTKVNDTIDSIETFFGGVSQIETTVDFHSAYVSELGEMRSTFALRLQPGIDRYYELGIVDDPAGTSESRTEIVESGGASTETRTTTMFENDLTFTIQYAKQFYDFTLRGGLIQSSGGFGFDYYFYNRKLSWTTEVFGIEETNLRSSLRWAFTKGVYMYAGVEDIFDSTDMGTSTFFGAGVFLTNDDLRLLLTGANFN